MRVNVAVPKSGGAMREWFARNFPSMDGPKWIMVPLFLATFVCVIIGFLDPIVKGEPYEWMSDELLAE